MTQLKPKTTTTTDQVQESTTSATPEPVGVITLTQPEDELIVHSDKILVKGTALPNKFVVIFVNDKEKIDITSQNGSFEQEITLSPGANIIMVHSFDAADQPIFVERLVVWEQELESSLPKEAPEASASSTATTPAKKKPAPTPTVTPKP